MKLNKKGVMGELGNLAVGIAVLAIVMTIVFLVISQGRTQLIDIDPCGNSTGTWVYNASDLKCHNVTINGTLTSELSHGMNGTHTLSQSADGIPGWVSLIVIGVVGSVLLGLVSLFRKN